jgi:hypothetical protein
LCQLQLKNPYSGFWKLNIAPQKSGNISYNVQFSHLSQCFVVCFCHYCEHIRNWWGFHVERVVKEYETSFLISTVSLWCFIEC